MFLTACEPLLDFGQSLCLILPLQHTPCCLLGFTPDFDFPLGFQFKIATAFACSALFVPR